MITRCSTCGHSDFEPEFSCLCAEILEVERHLVHFREELEVLRVKTPAEGLTFEDLEDLDELEALVPSLVRELAQLTGAREDALETLGQARAQDLADDIAFF